MRKDKQMKQKECRAFDFTLEARENEKHGHFIEGRAIVFGQPYDNGFFTEYIEPGALDNTDMKDVRLLVNHNTDMIPLARSRNNNANSTMQLSVVPEGGLDIRADLDTERNTEAQALYSATERGDISGMSFMFSVDGEAWENLDADNPVRRITSISRIYEVSAVTWPAYESTTLAARSDSEALESAEDVLENAKANARSDERARRIAELKEKLATIQEEN